MSHTYTGELAALLTAVFWTITAIAFESASKKIGSLAVNILRLFLAFIFLGIFGFFSTGFFFPAHASYHNWVWLSVSGLVGFVIGDLFLFQSYVVVGARISMLIMALAPPIAAVTGWLMLGEKMNFQSLAGMVITFAGISLTILSRKEKNPESSSGNRLNIRFKYPVKGLLLAFGGAAGQGVGLVLSKYGMQDYDVFAASQIRVITGVLGFALVITIYGAWFRVKDAFSNLPAMKNLSIGAFFGPFLGVSFSLMAVKFTSSGIASTIMSIVPVMIIAPSVFILKEKVSLREIIGAVIAVVGVSLFFI
ncbi:MAG: DMT family transporter [Lentimicrobiaceae bacterium]|nr:DMT family transporter [Lentimicrobiaceae bacterium]MCO5265963.1 DMT family transporter [Lentimicrobium sp.]